MVTSLPADLPTEFLDYIRMYSSDKLLRLYLTEFIIRRNLLLQLLLQLQFGRIQIWLIDAQLSSIR